MFSESTEYIEDLRHIASYDINWSMINNSSILVAGATGLIGTVFVDALMYKNQIDNYKLATTL